MGCFRGRPQLRFIVGLSGSWGTSRVNKGASSLSNLAVTSGSSSLAVASSLSSLTL